MSTMNHNLRNYNKDEVLSDIMLNEAYIGKTETLQEIESKIHEVRKLAKSRYNNINQSKQMLELNRLFEKQFGMDIFALTVNPSTDMNAWTYTIGRRFDMVNKKMRGYVVGDTSNGFRFRKGNGLCVIVNITYGLLSDDDFSDAEILAVILHEVGHNFGDCLYDELELYNDKMMEAYKVYIIYWAILYSCFLLFLPAAKTLKQFKIYNNKYQRKTQKKAQKKVRKNSVKGFFSGLKYAIKDKTNFYISVLSRITYGGSLMRLSKSTVSDKQKEVNKNSIGRQAEVIADKFPDIYGYAIENSTINAKFSDIGKNKVYQYLKNTRYASKNFDYQKELFDMNDFDEHPNTIQRIISNLNTLEREYEKEDLDPKVKEELKYQIKEIKKILDDLTDVSKDMSNIEKAQAIYFSYVRQECPESISKELEENIEVILDDALEENEKKYDKRS